MIDAEIAERTRGFQMGRRKRKYYISKTLHFFNLFSFLLFLCKNMKFYAVILDVSEVGTQDSSRQKWLIQTWMMIMTKK